MSQNLERFGRFLDVQQKTDRTYLLTCIYAMMIDIANKNWLFQQCTCWHKELDAFKKIIWLTLART